MRAVVPKLFTGLGIIFLSLGFVMAVGALARWQFGGGIAWFFLAHGGMYMLLGVGVFMRARWLLAALVLNLVGSLILYTATGLQGENVDVTRLLTNTLATLIALGITYASKNTLTHTQKNVVAGALFLVLWIFSYLTALLRVLG
ncbi:MAG: hypothetical protein Q8P58_01030 [Candidatus Adlerbacteria bacterium]|nr:hypothetical protein [Candidatus Adlerbacteria bacterium]